jgi:hypothetical protein
MRLLAHSCHPPAPPYQSPEPARYKTTTRTPTTASLSIDSRRPRILPFTNITAHDTMALDPRALEEKVRPPLSPTPPCLSATANCSLQKAKKTLQSAGGGFSFFSNKEEKYQNAADLYVQAANAYRLERMSTSPRARTHAARPPTRADPGQTRTQDGVLRRRRVSTATR